MIEAILKELIVEALDDDLFSVSDPVFDAKACGWVSTIEQRDQQYTLLISREKVDSTRPEVDVYHEGRDVRKARLRPIVALIVKKLLAISRSDVPQYLQHQRNVCVAPDRKSYFAAIGLLWLKGCDPQEEQFAFNFSFGPLLADDPEDLEASQILIKELSEWGIKWREVNSPWRIDKATGQIFGG